MIKKKIFILVGHPDTDSMSGALASAYEEGAKLAGHEVRRLHLNDLDFDPILHHGYRVIQPLEPDLLLIQENMKWADHFFLSYPNWWGTMPALLKGMFDRMFLPGFAFKFHKGKFWWDKLLKGRSARVVITMDNHPVLAEILFGSATSIIKSAILDFAGFAPIRVSRIGPLKFMSDKNKEAVKKEMFRLGKLGI